MFKQPKKEDYIAFTKEQGLAWKSKFSLCIEEAEYDEVGDIVNWYAGNTYEGRTLRNTPAGEPLQLDVRDEHGDKVDDFCIIVDPTSGQILNAWSETDVRVHEILKEGGRGSWDTIPEPSPEPSPNEALDSLQIEPAQRIIKTNAGLITVADFGGLRDHGKGRLSKEATVYLNEGPIALLYVTYEEGRPAEYGLSGLQWSEIVRYDEESLWEALRQWGNEQRPQHSATLPDMESAILAIIDLTKGVVR